MTSLTCDQCRLRKIKCEGGNPCFRCQKASLECSRNLTRQRRGPKVGNGRIIRRLRTEQFKGQTSDASSTVDAAFERPSKPVLDSDTMANTLRTSQVTQMQYPAPGPVLLSDSRDARSSNGSVTAAGQEISEVSTIHTSPISLHDRGQHMLHDARRPLSAPRTTNMPELPLSPASISKSVDFRERTSPAPGSAFSYSAFCDKPLTPLLPTSHPNVEDGSAFESSPLRLRGNHAPLDDPAIITLAERTGLPPILFSQCVKQFFRHLHASYPVLQESTFVPSLSEPLNNKERECLILSLCAFTVLRAPPLLYVNGNSPSDLSRRMIASCQAVRTAFDWVEKATLMTVIASYFLCMAYYDLEQKRSYEYYLREAIQLAYADDLRLDTGSGTETSDTGKILHGRMLVLLYITNRSGGVQRHKAILHLARTSIPSLALDPGDEEKLHGLQLLTEMFDLVNEDFMDTWLSSSYESAATDHPSPQPLSNKRIVDQLSFDVSNITETQQPDLLVTLRWLRLAYWQVSMKKGLVSSHAADKTLSYKYPMEIAQGLCEILQSLPAEAVFRHGRCILEKIFDITYALTDSLAIAGIPHNESPTLIYLLNYLTCAPRIHHGFSGILQKHIEGYLTPTNAI